MDLKFKSPKWVGNIYHTFEAICHEVDDFVSQETVKYVENQAQAVGGSVKRFYSNVVQDLLPSSLMQHGKHEAQILSVEKKDEDGAYVRPTTGTEENQVHIDVNNEHGNSSSGSEIKDSEHKKLDVVIGENGEKEELTDKECDTSFQEDDPTKVPMGETPYTFEESEPTEEWMNTNASSFEANDLKIEPSWAKEEWMITDADNVKENDLKKEPSRPNEGEELTNTNEENDLKESCRLKEKEEWTNANVNNVKENTNEESSWPKEMSLFCLENKNLPEASFSSDIPKIEATCDAHVGDIECVSDMSNLLPPSEVDFSVISADKTVESEIVSSSSPLSTEMIDVPHNEENICCYLEDEFQRTFDVWDVPSSSQPVPLVYCDDTELKPAFSSNAFDEDISTSDDITSLVASFEDNHCNDYHRLEGLMSFLKVGDEDDCVVDITDPSMVTIELSDDKAKLDKNCVLVEDKLVYGVYCRSRKHKSYKKILQDAFASRKRLRKEYEQLGILFGDIDIDPSQRQGHSLLPEIPSSSLGSENLSSGDISEWELL